MKKTKSSRQFSSRKKTDKKIGGNQFRFSMQKQAAAEKQKKLFRVNQFFEERIFAFLVKKPVAHSLDSVAVVE